MQLCSRYARGSMAEPTDSDRDALVQEVSRLRELLEGVAQRLERIEAKLDTVATQANFLEDVVDQTRAEIRQDLRERNAS